MAGILRRLDSQFKERKLGKMEGEFHADIGPQYEGEVIRKEDLYIEFGGPKVAHKLN